MSEPTAPSPDALAEAVLGIVAEVLQTTAVPPDADLLDLGYDSLRITQTAARVSERLGVDLPLEAYFDIVTPTDLVNAVRAAAPHLAEPEPAAAAADRST